MLIPEACKLVLEAGTMGQGGEIYVFDMGKPVRIVDLAKRMISLSGAKDIEIKFTGLRDGEKLYEEVLNDAEFTKPTYNPKIKIAAVIVAVVEFLTHLLFTP
jgi:FlaA1/EpsC-like NDP-sugar epimerase